MTLNTGGKVTLTLRPTSKGQTALAQNGSFKVQLRVTFDARSPRSTNQQHVPGPALTTRRARRRSLRREVPPMRR
jgi:hypothetical protein